MRSFGKGIALSGYIREKPPRPVVISAAMRASDPTVMDVVYKVISDRPTANVRALAFQDGQRSFAKVLRPMTFIEGTETNLGPNVAANIEHKLSWKVSADWDTDLAHVAFEVLAADGDATLPLELVTIPAAGGHEAMQVSWNAQNDEDLFNALLWRYAGGESDLTLTNGVLKTGDVTLVNGEAVSYGAAHRYLFGKMGYGVLAGGDLAHARAALRRGLPGGNYDRPLDDDEGYYSSQPSQFYYAVKKPAAGN